MATENNGPGKPAAKPAGAASGGKPNILVIWGDDIGWMMDAAAKGPGR